MDYIRRTYGVPARRGLRLLFIGGNPDPESDAKVRTRTGTIVGSRGQYLRVRMDGEAHIRTLHPTWRVEYLKTPNVEFSGVPAEHSSNHPAGGTSAATQG